ncbi:MAG: phosphatidate cytidylyltransferase [Bacteroidota bacterium]
MSNLAQRILTGLVGAVVVVGAVWVGDWPFAALMTLVALGAQYELYGLLRAGGVKPLVGLGLFLGAVAVVAPLTEAAASLLTVGALAVLAGVLFVRRETALLDAAGTLFGVVYPSALVGLVIALRLGEADWMVGTDAFWLTTTLLFCVWGSDSFAYFAGRAFGRRKLFERVSPNKTWEGAIGGAVGAVALASVAKVVVLDAVLTWPDVAFIGFACGVASQIGDLAESHFKRSVGVKDSATWLPGHGGLLDRIDAAVVSIPLVVIYLDLVKGLG